MVWVCFLLKRHREFLHSQIGKALVFDIKTIGSSPIVETYIFII